ncbi:unnamed protein product [Heterobilharzia americana]|nr:unnamed protein product [Heterobilharzia americana]
MDKSTVQNDTAIVSITSDERGEILMSPGEMSNGNTHFSSDHEITISQSVKHIKHFIRHSQEELRNKILPDHLKEGLDIVIVGKSPTLTSVYVGHHYADGRDYFWTCLSMAGLVPTDVSCYDDYKMLDYGIGFTNFSTTPTPRTGRLTRKQEKVGIAIMLKKMKKYTPKIVAFNGKSTYEAYVGHKIFCMGRQPITLQGTDTITFVMPSTSGSCTQLPRAEDKLPFFLALRKYVIMYVGI